MPDNKNQHYVPRCHLKPFSLDGQGRAINLFNHQQGLIRENVPISGQCAKSYFYGKDLAIERQLQAIEGDYARMVRKMEDSEPLANRELILLREFVMLQWCRTDGALRRRREAIGAMDELAHRGIEHLRRETPDMSQLQLVMGSLSVWVRSLEEVQDLRVLILRNLSGLDFVTSDDPAVLTNRVFLQRMRDANFGMASVGTIFVMPLGPRYAVICYDHDAYEPVGRRGQYLDIRREQDVRAVNEFQYLNSAQNIYFSGSRSGGQQVATDFAKVSDRRPNQKFRSWQGISEGIKGEFECFRHLKDGEGFDHRTPRIQFFSPLYPTPAHWMSHLTMRRKIHGWIKPGTAVAPVRLHHAQQRAGMRRIVIGVGTMPYRNGDFPERMYQRLTEAERVDAEARAARAAAFHETRDGTTASDAAPLSEGH